MQFAIIGPPAHHDPIAEIRAGERLYGPSDWRRVRAAVCRAARARAPEIARRRRTLACTTTHRRRRQLREIAREIKDIDAEQEAASGQDERPADEAWDGSVI